MMSAKFVHVVAACLFVSTCFAQNAYSMNLENELEKLAASSKGRVGICILNFEAKKPSCVNGTMKFPLQSVMKLIVGAVLLEAVDKKRMSLSDTLTLVPIDASPGPQDFADLIRSKGTIVASLEDLMRRSITESDSTAVDKLLSHLGSVSTVNEFLKRKKIEGISVDRNERRVQADSLGLEWHDRYSNNQKFEAAVNEVPFSKRDHAATNFLRDTRDTSTPLGMVSFLKALGSENMLSKDSTKIILDIMTQTKTGPNRLLAGTPYRWKLAHKTGTGRSWKGVNSATNDVGILSSPDGEKVAVAAFISGSSESADKRESLIAEAARLAVSSIELSKREKERSL